MLSTLTPASSVVVARMFVPTRQSPCNEAISQASTALRSKISPSFTLSKLRERFFFASLVSALRYSLVKMHLSGVFGVALRQADSSFASSKLRSPLSCVPCTRLALCTNSFFVDGKSQHKRGVTPRLKYARLYAFLPLPKSKLRERFFFASLVLLCDIASLKYV